MSKKDKLMKIIEQILELYPELEGVLVDGGMESPSKIVIISSDEMEKFAEEYGIDVEEIEIDDEQLEFDFDDDDEGGGLLQ